MSLTDEIAALTQALNTVGDDIKDARLEITADEEICRGVRALESIADSLNTIARTSRVTH